MDDLHLEGEEVQADADMAAQRKRPDAWAVSWEKRRLLIQEFTRPNDRGELSIHETDLYKTARYKSLRDLLARLLPGWEVEVHTYTVGIRGSHDPNSMDLIQVGVSVTSSRKEESSESVPRRAQPSLPHQAGPTFSTQVVLGISYVTYHVT